MSQLVFNSDNTDFEERVTHFVEVIIPVPIPGTFTYRVPQVYDSKIQIGSRVIVQFGRRKVYTGIVAKIHENPPQNYNAKYILELLDDVALVNQRQLDFFYWIANYYMCGPGQVMNAALPSGLKLSSQSFVQIHPQINEYKEEFEYSTNENLLLQRLSETDKLSYDEISDLLDVKQIHPIIKSLIRKESIILFEQVKDKFQPKKVKKVRLLRKYFEDEQKLQNLFASLNKKVKQQEVLLKYLTLVPIETGSKLNISGVVKSELLEGEVSPSSLNTLLKNEVFEEFEQQVSRFDSINLEKRRTFDLSKEQIETKDSIERSFSEKDVVLLHGVTGSGKTEIYIELIKEKLAAGEQVLYLLPEIALTTQIVSRLMKIFGNEMGIFHSKYSDNERVEVWQGIVSGKFRFVVGVRSSIFLPFSNLSLIIIDEEHETSYKQYDPAPRYHARDAAIVLGRIHDAKVLLGTATPSLESYYNALNGKYGLVEMMERFGGASLPTFELADLLEERKRKTIKGDFTSHLLNEIEKTLGKQEQVILFQNRRGYAPFLSCSDCNHVPQCENCSVSLTYHMYSNVLKCHYCGYQEPLPQICIACGSTDIKTIGFGTEKLEEDIKVLFPQARVQRMDQDTTRSKYSYQSIIDRFEKGETDILIGTQMLSKGLDFDRVSLVGIFDFDRMVHFPDFRSYERTFQLITQVSGRAGRKDDLGKVIVQTKDPNSLFLDKIVRHDYKSFYQSEIIERENFSYPPFHRLIRIILRDKDKDVVEAASLEFTKVLTAELNRSRILGPQEPIISRVRNMYIREIFVKLEKVNLNINSVKTLIVIKSQELKKNKNFSSIRIIFDVDPI